MGETLLRVEGLDVFYGQLQALWEVSFEVNEGEIFVLLGANGAGKSTTLRTLSGLVRPAAGSVWLDGERIDTLPPHQVIGRGLVHVPEGRRLFGEMTVEENLLMGSLAPEARERRAETLEHVFSLFPRLLERRHQMAGDLSGGERQMAAIGRGLMGRPRILMLDEPSLGLSPLLVKELFAIITELNREGVTILLVEQNVKSSLGHCHRATVLENGRTVMSGSGQELLEDGHIKKAYLGV